MSWIKTLSYEQATGSLKTLYDRIRGPGNYIDNILSVHSLRPHTLKGHMYLYKNVLHHRSNTLPKWLLEALGVYVSILNRCDYCVDHHFAGMQRLVNDDVKSGAIRKALEHYTPEEIFTGKELALFRYAEILTCRPDKVSLALINDMRSLGIDDGQILEANQVVSYFAYANRTVHGLGVTTEGDIPGLSPGDSDDEENWTHG